MSTSPRLTTGVLCLFLCALLGGCQERKRPGTEPLHVLLFTVEGLRADHVSSLSYFRPTTLGCPEDPQFETKPGMDFDAIANRGVQFPNCFAPSFEPAVALASLLSGSSSVDGASELRLPEVMQAAGFHTIACVAGQDDSEPSPFSRGFEVFEQHPRDKDAIARAWLHARAAIEEESIERVFVWIHLSEIGPPFVADPLPSIITQRDLATTFVDPNYGGPFDGTPEALERANRGELKLTLEDEREIIAGYDGQVARAAALMRAFLERWTYTVKDSFGTYVDAPHEDERWARTLVVGCGVTGAELGEHGAGFGEASTLHDSSLRVPLFFSHSGSLTGERIFSNLVELADVTPTLLDWFALNSTDEATGRSLLPLLDTYVRKPFAAEPVFGHVEGVRQTIRTPNWRLIRDGGLGVAGLPALFGLGTDPREERDVAPAHLEVVTELLDRLEE